MKKLTIKQNVELNKNVLLPMNQFELTTWAKEQGYDNRSAFANFKKALLTIDVDYDALKQQRHEAKREELEKNITKEVVLYSDAKASKDRFGITDKDGNAVWYGRFFEDDRDYNGEQSSGELAAAKKAVWLASKISEKVGGVVKLTLKVDAEWLCWANETDGRGGKAKQLRQLADRYNVVLNVEHVYGCDNPADYYTTCPGYQSYKDVNLATLCN